MFDDYNYKKISKRINLKFIQDKDEPLYPWEIAGFLNKINTVYYKFDLLNSICSALNNGIAPEDVFILNHSLPLYKRYSRMNLLSDSEAAELFYDIGLPTPLIPKFESYYLNFLYQAFSTINSFLYKNHVKPLPIKTIREAFDVLKTESLSDAEEFIIEAATNRAVRSQEKAFLRGDLSERIGWQDIEGCLVKYRNTKEQLQLDIQHIQDALSSEVKTAELLDAKNKVEKRRLNILLEFFNNFNKIQRPLVYVRVSEDKFRVLGRFLVNKKEKTGLELKEIKKNSPLGAIIEGGITLYQTVRQEKRAEELHKEEKERAAELFNLEKEKMQIEVLTAKENYRTAQLTNLKLELEIAQKLESAIEHGDMKAIDRVEDGFLKKRLVKAYQIEEHNAERVMKEQGLTLDRASIKVIDIEI